jgi:NADH:ubiquinone oxidoreductase subunit 4 (subunit M)
MIGLVLAAAVFVVAEQLTDRVTSTTPLLQRLAAVGGAISGASGVLAWIMGAAFGWPAVAAYAAQLVCLLCLRGDCGCKNLGNLHGGDSAPS